MKNKKWLKLLLVLLALVVLGVVFTYSFSEKEIEEPETTDVLINESTVNSQTEQETESLETDTSTTETVKSCVYVCGEVKNPDVYYLDSGARIHEAVSLAGGLTENADANYINMAQVISDGQQIYIPSKDEVANGLFKVDTGNVAETDDGIVNINSADASELMKLPGIGNSKAEAIISYRKEAGGFSSVEDIKNVSGIGDSLYEQIKDKIKI